MAPPSHADLLVCPACHGRLDEPPGALFCPTCAATFPSPAGIPEFVPPSPSPPGIAQRFMEAPAVVSVYERLVRPLVTRLGSSIEYAEEEAYLDRWCTPAPGIVADVACGTGRYTRWLATHKAGPEPVVGLDLSWSMLLCARDAARGALRTSVLFARASAQALPIAAGAAGAVNCSGALHLFADPHGAIREVARVLAPGGTFTALTAGWAGAAPVRLAQALFGRATAFRFFDDRELSSWLAPDLELLDLTRRGMVILFAARRRA